MTRDDLKRQILSRASVPADKLVEAEACLDKWIAMYPAHFKFGPAAVMAGTRMVKRELRLK